MRKLRLFGIALLGCAASTATAAENDRQWLDLAAGTTAAVYGTQWRADTSVLAISSLSSEFVTVAVIDGTLNHDGKAVRAGETLVVPIDKGAPRRFAFDARRLAATLPPAWLDKAQAPLDRIAARQKSARFWGRLEPVNLNASAPVAPELEAVRAGYLGNDTVASLRRAAQGNPQALAALTAKRFAEALAAGDARAVADLIDPKPFTDTGAVAGAWQAARLGFATKLTGDAALKAAMAGTPAANTALPHAFDVGSAFRIQLVARDRAMFVTSVEPLS